MSMIEYPKMVTISTASHSMSYHMCIYIYIYIYIYMKTNRCKFNINHTWMYFIESLSNVSYVWASRLSMRGWITVADAPNSYLRTMQEATKKNSSAKTWLWAKIHWERIFRQWDKTRCCDGKVHLQRRL